jgi:hypothetical protein
MLVLVQIDVLIDVATLDLPRAVTGQVVPILFLEVHSLKNDHFPNELHHFRSVSIRHQKVDPQARFHLVPHNVTNQIDPK